MSLPELSGVVAHTGVSAEPDPYTTGLATWQAKWLEHLQGHTDLIVTRSQEPNYVGSEACGTFFNTLEGLSGSAWDTIDYILDPDTPPEARLDFDTAWPHVERGFEALLDAYHGTRTPIADMPRDYFAARLMRGYGPLVKALATESEVMPSDLRQVHAHARSTLAHLIHYMPDYARYMDEKHLAAGSYLRTLTTIVLLGDNEAWSGGGRIPTANGDATIYSTLMLPARPQQAASSGPESARTKQPVDLYITNAVGEWIPVTLNARTMRTRPGYGRRADTCQLPIVAYTLGAYHKVYEENYAEFGGTLTNAVQACEALVEILTIPSAEPDPAAYTPEFYQRMRVVAPRRRRQFKRQVANGAFQAMDRFASPPEQNQTSGEH